MTGIKFNVAGINRLTEAEGPYKRLTIWFQGCDIRCEGCCNPAYQPLVPKHILTLEEIVDIVREAKEEYGIEGVTYSGREPTLQQNLPELTKRIKELGLGVISFTGKKYEDAADLLTGCDVVLDGEYVEAKRDKSRRILGSSNQRIICLTDRYRDVISGWFSSRDKAGIDVNVGEKIVASGDSF